MDYCILRHGRHVVQIYVLTSCVKLIAVSFENYKKYISFEYVST
jgi:hypothetical protein